MPHWTASIAVLATVSGGVGDPGRRHRQSQPIRRLSPSASAEWSCSMPQSLSPATARGAVDPGPRPPRGQRAICCAEEMPPGLDVRQGSRPKIRLAALSACLRPPTSQSSSYGVTPGEPIVLQPPSRCSRNVTSTQLSRASLSGAPMTRQRGRGARFVSDLRGGSVINLPPTPCHDPGEHQSAGVPVQHPAGDCSGNVRARQVQSGLVDHVPIHI
jgi:hypothetical protein